MAIDKSKWNKNIKVSQKTIDDIKKMGMAKALKTVAGASAASKDDASAREWAEGVKRLYTAERVNAAMKASKPAGATSGPLSAKTKATYKTSGPKSANTPAKSKPKSGFRITPREVVGTALAVGALAASKGKAGAVAARLAPGLAKSRLGKAAIGNAPKVYPKAPGEGVRVVAKGSLGKTTSATAKAGNVGTKSEYATKATQDAARKALAARAARVKSEGVTVGSRGSFGKTTAKTKKATPANKKGKK